MSGTQPPGPAAPGTIFFLSDYGLRDEFVGVVHAVLARLAPGTAVIDLTHEIAPFDVRSGAAALARALPHLGEGLVLAVVDPGVGGPRRAIALETAPASGPTGGWARTTACSAARPRPPGRWWPPVTSGPGPARRRR